MEKFGGLIIIVLIWGGAIYFLFDTLLLSEVGGSDFLGSSLLALSSNLNQQKEIIGIFDKGKFQKATVHFNRKVDIFDIKASPINPELIFAGSNRGLFISRDAGLNWYSFSDVEHKINSYTKIYKILFNPRLNNQSFISVSLNGKGVIYKSQDNFFSLEKIIEIDEGPIYDFALYGDSLYLGLANGQLLLYSLTNKNIQLLKTFNSAITNLEISQDAEGLVYLTLKTGGFWKSENGGQSFRQLKFSDDLWGVDKFNNFLISPLDNFSLYAATNNGLIKSLNGGETWQAFKSLPVEKSAIFTLALRESPFEIFVASNGKIYKSQNYGASWRVLDPEFNGREISVILVEGEKIIVGSVNN